MLLPADASAYRRPKAKPTEIQTSALPARAPQGPLQIIVSIGSQRLHVYDKIGLIETSTVSTGVGGFPTPTGLFSIIDKEEVHYSNIYRGASMPFMQRLTMSGVALHSGMVTGRPASHGCIRLPHPFAIKLYRLTKLGARVIIAHNEPTPVEIAHPRLFTYQPPPPAPETETTPLSKLTVTVAREVDKRAQDARVGTVTAERNAMLQALPVSVFVSRAEGKVFVRHGFRPLLEAQVAIGDPERPIGTHVFTAVEAKANGTDIRWLAVSVSGEGMVLAGSKRAERGRIQGEPEPAPATTGQPSSAAEALDRIEFPAEAVTVISEMLSPGASLIISDHGLNREIRQSFTDFVVLTR